MSYDQKTYERKLARALDAMGSLYTVDDLLTAIGDGRMQSFATNNSWAITQIEKYPRARQLHIVATIGDLDDMPDLNRKVLKFANDIGVGLVSAFGRRGWLPMAQEFGWKVKTRSYLYHKDL